MGDPVDEGAGVVRVARCRLTVTQTPWAFALAHADDISTLWRQRSHERPALFNGTVYLTRATRFVDGAFEAMLTRTDFKSYLYWREHGFPEAGVRDGFGTAILCSGDGHILLGRQRAGHVNDGLLYPPSGFIDAHDVAADGTIDIAASIGRELIEETGLRPEDGDSTPGFLICSVGAQLAIARVWRLAAPASALCQRIEAHLAGDPAAELEGIVAIPGANAMDGLPIPPYARRLLRHVFADLANSRL